MVINHKKFNDNIVFYGYYIPNKMFLLNRIQGASWFLKMDCKSGYQQIKMDEESIPLITFSTPQEHYKWTIMPFGLKMYLKYSKEKWITSSKILITIIQCKSMKFLSFSKLQNNTKMMSQLSPKDASIMVLYLIKTSALMLNKRLSFEVYG